MTQKEVSIRESVRAGGMWATREVGLGLSSQIQGELSEMHTKVDQGRVYCRHEKERRKESSIE